MQGCRPRGAIANGGIDGARGFRDSDAWGRIAPTTTHADAPTGRGEGEGERDGPTETACARRHMREIHRNLDRHVRACHQLVVPARTSLAGRFGRHQLVVPVRSRSATHQERRMDGPRSMDGWMALIEPGNIFAAAELVPAQWQSSRAPLEPLRSISRACCESEARARGRGDQ